MNAKDIQTKRNNTWRKYHTPGCGNYMTRKVNAIFISTSNGKPHEMKKADVCYDLRKQNHNFITEAVSNHDQRRVDIVDLDTGQEIEIVDTCITKMTQAAIDRGTDILVVKV